MENLEGRTAFITGGARGIGLGIARALAREGVRLALVDIDQTSLATARAELSRLVPTETYVLDVTDRDAYARVANDARNAFGPITVLINNAGVVDSTAPTRLSYDMYDHVLGINLDGVYNGFHNFVPSMIDSGTECYIVNTSSEAGLAQFGSGFLYHASKYAVVGLSESMRIELAPYGIGVSVLSPGPVATDIVENARRARPDTVPAHSARVNALLDNAHRTLQDGVSIDDVGRLVVDGIRNNKAYIHTGNSSKSVVQARAAEIAAAMDYAAEFLERG